MSISVSRDEIVHNGLRVTIQLNKVEKKASFQVENMCHGILKQELNRESFMLHVPMAYLALAYLVHKVFV